MSYRLSRMTLKKRSSGSTTVGMLRFLQVKHDGSSARRYAFRYAGTHLFAIRRPLASSRNCAVQSLILSTKKVCRPYCRQYIHSQTIGRNVAARSQDCSSQ
jgi:hypothetical protein